MVLRLKHYTYLQSVELPRCLDHTKKEITEMFRCHWHLLQQRVDKKRKVTNLPNRTDLGKNNTCSLTNNNTTNRKKCNLPGLFSLLLLESNEWSWGRKGFGLSTNPLLGSVVQFKRNLSVGPLLKTSNGPHSWRKINIINI